MSLKQCLIQFKKGSHLVKFLRLISVFGCHETTEKIFSPHMPAMLALTEDQERVVQ